MAVVPSIDPLVVVAAFMMHTGARHIQFDLTDAQKQVMAHPTTKMIILFGMFYISTRNLVVSVFLVVLYNLAIHVLLNEKHPWNLFSYSWLVDQGIIDNTHNSDEASIIDIYKKNLDMI